MDRTKLKKFLVGTILGASGCAIALAASFNRFTPATGVLVGDATTYVTSAATSSNIRALWSGTCDNTTVLGGDGNCVVAGSPTGQPLTKTDDTNVTATLGGTPATALLQPTSLTLGWTGQLSVPRGGTGAGTLTGYVKGSGTSALTASATIPYADLTGTPTLGSLAALNTINGSLWSGTDLAVADGGTGASTLSGVLKGNGTSAIGSAAFGDVSALWGGTCNSGTFLRGDGTCAAAGGSGTVSSVGLTMPSGFSVTGTPVTTSGTLAVTTSLNGVLRGNGTGFTTATSSNITGLWSGTCNSGSYLRGDGACVALTPIPFTNATAFTPTCTGFAVCPITANSAFYSVTGNIVCLYIRNFGGTSNSTSFTITLPPGTPGMHPNNTGSQGPSGFTSATNNAVIVQARYWIIGDGSGTITFYNGAVTAATNTWTASGSKGLNQDFNVCYAGPNI